MVIKVNKCQNGFILIEILAGLAILGIIAVGVLNGLSTTFRGIDVSQERVAAESLARSQIEYIRVQDYVPVADYDPEDPANRYELIDIPGDLVAAGYAVEIDPPQTVDTGNATGGFELQSITVGVERGAQAKLNITIYRVSS